VYAGGYDFAYDDNDPMDLYASGHGTHVGGTVVAVAPEVALYGIKVFQDSGGAFTSDVIAGITWSMDPNGDGNFDDHLDVINMSLSGGGYPNDVKCEAVKMAHDAGVISVVSAGNSGNRLFATARTPSSCWEAITVGANTKGDVPEMASFSSFGPSIFIDKDLWKPDITGPGVTICAAKSEASTRALCMATPPRSGLSGTSMSSPVVTGVVALAVQAHPSYTPVQIKRLLKGSADLLVGYTYDGQGAGEVNALKTVQGSDLGPPTSSMTPSGTWLGGASGGDASFSRQISVVGIPDGSPLVLSEYSMSVTPISDGKFTATVNVPERQAEGLYISRVSYGDDTRFTGVFVKDNAPPIANLVFSSPQESPFSVALEAADNLCLSVLKLRIPYPNGNMQGYAYILNKMYYCNIEGKKDLCFPTPCLTTKTYTLSNRSAPEGTYEVTGEAIDAAGNSTQVSDTLIIGPEPSPPDPPDPPVPPDPPIDVTPPTLTITSPADGSVVPRKSSFVVTCDASDDVSVSVVRMALKNTICTDYTAPYSCKFTTTGKPKARYTVSVYAQDAAGNKSAMQGVTIYSETIRK